LQISVPTEVAAIPVWAIARPKPSIYVPQTTVSSSPIPNIARIHFSIECTNFLSK